MQQRAHEPPSRVDGLSFLFRMLEASVIVFTRARFGERYLGVPGLCVVPAVLVYTTFWQGYDLEPLMVYLGLWGLAYFCAHADIAERRKKGKLEHSQYSGFPWFLGSDTRSERAAKLFYEPGLLFVIAVVVASYDQPLGGWLMWGTVGAFFSSAMADLGQRRRMTDVRDAYIEQSMVARQFRDEQRR